MNEDEAKARAEAMSNALRARREAWREALMVEVDKAIDILELDINEPCDVFVDITASFHRISERVSAIMINGDEDDPIFVADDRSLTIRLQDKDIMTADVGDDQEYWRNGALYWRKI